MWWRIRSTGEGSRSQAVCARSCTHSHAHTDASTCTNICDTSKGRCDVLSKESRVLLICTRAAIMEVGDAAGDNTVLHSTVFTYTQLWFSELISSPLENVSLVAWSKKKKCFCSTAWNDKSEHLFFSWVAVLGFLYFPLQSHSNHLLVVPIHPICRTHKKPQDHRNNLEQLIHIFFSFL